MPKAKVFKQAFTISVTTDKPVKSKDLSSTVRQHLTNTCFWTKEGDVKTKITKVTVSPVGEK